MIKRLREQFLDDAKIRGVTSATIRSYDCHLKPFITFLQARGITPLSVTSRDLKDFIRSQMDKKLSVATVNDYIRTFKQFYKWMASEDYIDNDPSEKIKKLKEPKREKSVLKPEDISKLLSLCPSDTFQGIRNKAIIGLLWDCGLRRNEIVTAKLDNLDLKNARLGIIGKGNKPATVPLSRKTVKTLKLWTKTRGQNSSPYLFTSEKGTKLGNDFLTHMVIKLGRKAGLKVYPHLIRHSVITWLAEQGMEPFSLQAFARHEDLKTTMDYVQKARLAQRLPEEHKRFSPGNKI